jgi:ribosomal protein S14
MTHYSKYKDYKIRRSLKITNIKLFVLKYFLKDSNKSKNFRFKINLKIQKLYSDAFQTKVKNRCIHSTKVRSVSRISNLTKASFKDNLNFGKVNGFTKSS